MHKLVALLLAIAIAVFAVGALAAATSGFPCDFVHVARREAPQCGPKAELPLVSMARGGVTGS